MVSLLRPSSSTIDTFQKRNGEVCGSVRLHVLVLPSLPSNGRASTERVVAAVCTLSIKLRRHIAVRIRIPFSTVHTLDVMLTTVLPVNGTTEGLILTIDGKGPRTETASG